MHPPLKQTLLDELLLENQQRITAISNATGRLAASEALADYMSGRGLSCSPVALSAANLNGGYVQTWAQVDDRHDLMQVFVALRKDSLTIERVIDNKTGWLQLHLKDVDVPLHTRGTTLEAQAAAMALDMLIDLGNGAPASLQRQAA